VVCEWRQEDSTVVPVVSFLKTGVYPAQTNKPRRSLPFSLPSMATKHIYCAYDGTWHTEAHCYQMSHAAVRVIAHPMASGDMWRTDPSHRCCRGRPRECASLAKVQSPPASAVTTAAASGQHSIKLGILSQIDDAAKGAHQSVRNAVKSFVAGCDALAQRRAARGFEAAGLTAVSKRFGTTDLSSLADKGVQWAGVMCSRFAELETSGEEFGRLTRLWSPEGEVQVHDISGECSSEDYEDEFEFTPDDECRAKRGKRDEEAHFSFSEHSDAE